MATMMEKKPISIRIDERGRICLPRSLRKALELEPGDTLFAQAREGRLELAKAENPFDGLARHAIAEDDAGRTRDIRDIAKEWGVDLEGERNRPRG